MAYEIRFFNERGVIEQVRAFQCDDDDEGLERLAKVRHPHALELWQGDRLVWRFEDGTL